jgi:transcriptional regulator with XRE-family HTH domain
MTMTPEELVEQRKDAGLSQTDLGKMLGFTQNEISRMESGKRPIPNHIKYYLSAGVDGAFGGWFESRPVVVTVQLSLDVYQSLREEASTRFRQPEDHASFIITNYFTQQGE